jgi:hypothetical protein
MSAATTVPSRRSAEREPVARPAIALLGALAGLAFVAILLVQNVVRLAIAPANDATAATSVNHFNDNRVLYSGLGASFAAGGVALAVFVANAWERLGQGASRPWAQVGVIGVAGIVSLFAAEVACEFALLAVTHQTAPAEAAVAAIWALHNGIFAVLTTFIGIATLGFSLAAVRARLIPSVFRILGPASAALLVVTTLAGPQITAGDLQPVMGLSGIGFVGWLALVAAISVGLARETND